MRGRTSRSRHTVEEAPSMRAALSASPRMGDAAAAATAAAAVDALGTAGDACGGVAGGSISSPSMRALAISWLPLRKTLMACASRRCIIARQSWETASRGPIARTHLEDGALPKDALRDALAKLDGILACDGDLVHERVEVADARPRDPTPLILADENVLEADLELRKARAYGDESLALIRGIPTASEGGMARVVRKVLGRNGRIQCRAAERLLGRRRRGPRPVACDRAGQLVEQPAGVVVRQADACHRLLLPDDRDFRPAFHRACPPRISGAVAYPDRPIARGPDRPPRRGVLLPAT